ncbi:MAG: hypothetical protein Q8O53_00735 [Candidatus Moranbacteria bacterium]|nr:hypothetical protein [Candidatus Moranbacteria bacterium]
MSLSPTKLVLFFFVLLAFFTPLTAVIAFEKTKRLQDQLAAEEAVVAARKEAKLARYQYYLDLYDHKNELQKTMANAKTQYEQLLADQPELMKSNQMMAKRTMFKPIAPHQMTTKPKSSTKTKTS